MNGDFSENMRILQVIHISSKKKKRKKKLIFLVELSN